MIFLAPAVLLGLLALPALYFLLRLTPPAARRQAFPPLALLRDLPVAERTPRRMPLWLLLLRLLAAGLVILGLAGPSRHPAPALAGAGPVLLVVDNGWASAGDWAARRNAALRIVDGAGRAGRGVAILATAREASGAAPQILGVMAAAVARQVVAGLQPQPWPVDRAAAAAALREAPAPARRIYLADGITDGGGFDAFMRALRPDAILSDGVTASLLAPGGVAANGDIVARLLAGSGGDVLAETAGGDVLARAKFGADGLAAIDLPLALNRRVAKLVLAGSGAAGGVALLDGASHVALVGLAAGSANAEAAYLGALYFVRRALPAGSQVVTGDFGTLTRDGANVIVLADVNLSAAELGAARDFVAQGGVVIRFAGPLTAAAPDGLAPDALLAGDRRLGGALTWTAPQGLAAFAASSPFAGLRVDQGAKISRQVLADPTQLDPATVWARLADGTPIVLGKPVGRGYLVTVLTTANADWSGLALSGLFPDMLGRLVALAQGAPARPSGLLPLVSAIGAFGEVAPASAPASISAASVADAIASPAQPPGVYGAGGAAVALNLGGHVPPVVAAALPGAVPLAGAPPPRDFGPDLIAAALALLAADLLVSLWLRGAVRWLAVLAVAMGAPAARAQDAALATTLAYVTTGDAAADRISADGLNYLSAVVSSHSSARLGAAAGVIPGVDALNLYPLLYWPVLANAAAPSPAACAALASYMQHGGLLVIDTQGGDAEAPGSGAGFAPGAGAALARATSCLDLPPLEALGATNVLAHCFYIVQDFPGRFTGAPVYLATGAARDADGVTPVLIGQNDWAGAWARDAAGIPEQTPIPDGEDQRTLAERFGTNLVIYALTGSYKADQANLPALLDRLGQ
jgi:hypothetical protein